MRCLECKNWFELDFQSERLITGRCGIVPKMQHNFGFFFYNQCKYPEFFERVNTREYELRLRFTDQNCNIFEENK